MPVMNYETLKDQIQSFANREDDAFKNQIPNFIQQGINRLYSEAKNIGWETRVKTNNTIAQNQTIVPKPVDWLKTISFELYSEDQKIFKFLSPRSYEFCRSYWPNPTLTSEPQFYSYFNAYKSFFISPTPDKEYKYRLIYLRRLLFDENNSTNFLTERYPRLLFYACMLEAMPFLKDDERLGSFEQLYASSLSDINKDSANRYVDRTSERDKD